MFTDRISILRWFEQNPPNFTTENLSLLLHNHFYESYLFYNVLDLIQSPDLKFTPLAPKTTRSFQSSLSQFWELRAVAAWHSWDLWVVIPPFIWHYTKFIWSITIHHQHMSKLSRDLLVLAHSIPTTIAPFLVKSLFQWPPKFDPKRSFPFRGTLLCTLQGCGHWSQQTIQTTCRSLKLRSWSLPQGLWNCNENDNSWSKMAKT